MNLLILKAFIFFLIFFPIIFLFISVFTSKFTFSQLENFTLKDFNIFIKSLIISTIIAIISSLIGLSLSLIFECTNISTRILYFSLFIPLLIPPFITTFSWIVLLAEKISMPSFIFNELGLIFFLSLSFFPLSLIIISLGIRNLDKNYIEAGKIFNNKKILRKIVLPLSKQHFLISLLIIFFLAFSEYTVPAFLRVNVYSNIIFAQFAAFFNLPNALIYSIPPIIVSFLIVLFTYFFVITKKLPTIYSFTKAWENFIILSRSKRSILYFYLYVLLLFSLIVPFATLMISSKFKIIEALLTSKESLLNSFLITILTLIFLIPLSFLVSYSLQKNYFIIFLIVFPLSLSSPIIGISLINLYSMIPLPIYGTILLLLIGYCIKFLPFGLFIFSSFLNQISRSIIDASKIFSRNEFNTIVKIFIPLMKKSFFVSFALLFIFIFEEIQITQLLSPPGFQTLPQRIETLMHYGNYEYVSALSLFLSTIVIIIALTYLIIFRKI